MAVLKPGLFWSLFCTVSFLQCTLGSPILDSILNPIADVIDTIGSGQGLVQGTLGAVQGILGVEQR
jgi:hypothetical protein